MDDERSIPVGIIGAGRLGVTLAAGLSKAGSRVAAVTNGRRVSGTGGAVRVAELSDLVFLAVPDAAIAEVCAAIRWEPRHLVVHCSGAVGLEALGPAVNAGATTGCLHPLQTFPSREAEPVRFEGIWCGIEAAEPLGSLLEGIAVALGSTPFRLEGVDRALYHAAAATGSNLVIALASAATRLWTLAGLPPESGREALSPLLLAAARNVSERELADALTGPIARGDISTVERHMAALRADPGLREMYRLLSAELLQLPLGHSEAVLKRLRGLLEP